jgi:Glucose-regulated metallo-peptidase M90
VTGGTGQDRFLDWTNTLFGDGETRTDVAAEDAVVFFRNDGEQWVFLGSNMGLTQYTAGSWSEAEIESVDTALATLQGQTGNTRLLKTSGGGSLTFHMAGDAAGSPAGGWNSGGGTITLTNAGAASDLSTQNVTIHEIAHNWDDESPFYAGWLALSGWERNIPGWHDAFPPAGKVKSGDGGWWHNSNAQFARDYGKMNPLEDFATSWEAFFGFDDTQVTAKMTHLQAFFDYITALG